MGVELGQVETELGIRYLSSSHAIEFKGDFRDSLTNCCFTHPL